MNNIQNEIDLLNQAAFEIQRLRKENELMHARLEMFDKCMLLLHTALSYPGEGMSEDLVWKIEKHIAIVTSENKTVAGN